MGKDALLGAVAGAGVDIAVTLAPLASRATAPPIAATMPDAKAPDARVSVSHIVHSSNSSLVVVVVVVAMEAAVTTNEMAQVYDVARRDRRGFSNATSFQLSSPSASSLVILLASSWGDDDHRESCRFLALLVVTVVLVTAKCEMAAAATPRCAVIATWRLARSESMGGAAAPVTAIPSTSTEKEPYSPLKLLGEGVGSHPEATKIAPS